MNDDDEVPQGYTLLEGFDTISGKKAKVAVPASWLTSILAKCHGQKASFMLKKLIDGLFNP